MIIFFTSNTDGGIVQLALQLTAELIELNVPCKCFLPDHAIGVINNDVQNSIIHYKKFKAVLQNDRRIRELAETITSFMPSVIWYVDSSTLSAELCSFLSKESPKKYEQLFTVHDPLDHPTNTRNIRSRLKGVLLRSKKKAAFRNSDKIVTLSPESEKVFGELYPEFMEKIIVFNLGAHIPDVEGEKPEECNELKNSFILFFGRIDKYKGIATLLRAFEKRKNREQMLIIAGRGNFTEEEEELIKSSSNLLLLNRYIKDEEQIWLFKNARALVLPYVEASQSGIIPIAYKFGVPVIVTNIPGLTQFVEDNRTGIVCNSNSEMIEAINNIDVSAVKMKAFCTEYYKNNLDWHYSLTKILKYLNYRNEVPYEG